VTTSSDYPRTSPLWLRLATRAANYVRNLQRRSHAWRVRSAARALNTLLSSANADVAIAPRAIAYLRKVDPWVFEEVVLCSLEAAGFAVWRSRRYSGDGGCDGRVHVPGFGWCPIQTKRYSSHVDAAHVRAFSALVSHERRRLGLFIHTGRTGQNAWVAAGQSAVVIVSGRSLVGLVLERRLAIPSRLGVERTASPRLKAAGKARRSLTRTH
jgi:restriction system protein